MATEIAHVPPGTKSHSNNEAANEDLSREGAETTRTDAIVSPPVPSSGNKESATDVSTTDVSTTDSDDENGIEPVLINHYLETALVPTIDQIVECCEEKGDCDHLDSRKTCMGEGNLEWMLAVFSDEDALIAEVKCANSSHQWEADARVQLTLVSSRGENLIYSQNDLFNWENKIVEQNLCSWDDLMDPDNGYVDSNGNINIEAKISFQSITGVRLPKKHNFSSASRLSDVILLVDEKRIYANKAILALASPVFEDLFYNESEDREEIRIEKVTYKDFIRFLRHIYTRNTLITARSVESLLVLAERYQAEALTEEADQFLCYSEDFSVEEKLLMADKHALLNLQDHCMTELNSMEKIKMIRRTDEYRKVSADMKADLLEHLMMKEK